MAVGACAGSILAIVAGKKEVVFKTRRGGNPESGKDT
jgi:hypothetical protein